MKICEFKEPGRTIVMIYEDGLFVIVQNGEILIETTQAIDAWNTMVDRIDVSIRKRIIKKMREQYGGLEG
jgi:hypothetical protein